MWYFPYTCHWLGLDVHDVQDNIEKNGDGVILQTGIRIEGDILITEEGNENLSDKAPRTVKEIEEMMK